MLFVIPFFWLRLKMTIFPCLRRQPVLLVHREELHFLVEVDRGPLV